MDKEDILQLLKKNALFNEWYSYVKDIIESDEFQIRKLYLHHDDSVYHHCISVSFKSYMIARNVGANKKNCAIAGLLHDFYYQPWMENIEKKPLLKKHGFVHAKEARDNAYNYFEDYMNPIIDNIILRHMFPLNKVPPKYKEAWLVSFVDKIVSIDFIEKESLSKTFGLNKKGK